MVTVGPIRGPVAGGINAGIRSQLQIQNQSPRKQRSTGGGSWGRCNNGLSRKVCFVDASQSSGICQKPRGKLVEKGNHKLKMVGISRQGFGMGEGRQAVTKRKVPARQQAGSDAPVVML